MTVVVHVGDCVEVLDREIPPDSIDTIETDPPYGLEFMGRDWDKLDAGLPQENVWKGRRGKGGGRVGTDDSSPGARHSVGYGAKQTGFRRCARCGKRQFSGTPCECPEPEWITEYNQGAPSSAIRMQRWHERWARAAYRVLKPGGILLAFGGTRTYHRLACAIEDAGFEIGDAIGFLNTGDDFDAMRETWLAAERSGLIGWMYGNGFPKHASKMKPSWEPIVFARKPAPAATLLNIEDCRLPFVSPEDEAEAKTKNRHIDFDSGARVESGIYGADNRPRDNYETNGRYPPNVAVDPDAAAAIDAQTGNIGGGAWRGKDTRPSSSRNGYGRGDSDGWAGAWHRSGASYGDEGGASRFYYCPKASVAERDAGLSGFYWRKDPASPVGWTRITRDEWRKLPAAEREEGNIHPTVKPVKLLQYYARLATPKGGTVLDLFGGSGSVGVACELEDLHGIVIEKEPEYAEIIKSRVAHARSMYQPSLF